MNAWSGTDRLNDGDVMGPSVVGTARESAKLNTPPLKNGTDLRESGYLIAVGSRTARFRRRHMNRFRNLALLVLFLFLVIAIIVLLVLYIKNKHQKPKWLCTSKECLRSAANLAVSMDPSVDPCDDFHQYACGNWASEHPRPDIYTSYDWFRDKQSKVYALVRDMLSKNGTDEPKPVKQAKDLYASCMDTDKLEKIGVKPIYDILESLNLPRYPTHINATEDVDLSTFTFDWLDTVIKIKTQLGMDVLIGFDIFTDPQNSSVYRLVMGSPETTNPFPSLYTEKKRHSRQTQQSTLPLNSKLSRNKPPEEPLILDIEDYNIKKKQKKSEGEDEDDRKYIYFYSEIIKIFVMDSGKLNDSGLDEIKLDSSIISSATDFYMLSNDVYELETGNSTDLPDNDDFNIPDYSVDEIQSHTDKYVESNNGTTQPIWKRYLEGIFNSSTVILDFEQDKVLVSKLDMQYMEMMALLVSKTDPAVLELYLWVKVVEVLALHTTKELRLLYYRSYDNRHRHHRDLFLPPRSLQCSSNVNDMFGMAVAYAIVEPDFFNTTRPKILTMINLIKDALATLVGKVKWMDDDTKLATFRKIISMNTFIGFPTWFYRPGKLEEFYEGIEVSRDTYLENLVNIVQVKARKALNRLRSPNYFSWATDPTEVNAYHTFQENTITVPMVMLQYPFFDLGLESLNYGSLGTILGHEITHGFDNFGRQFDKNGNLIPWWSNDTIGHYVNMTQCFVDQYSSYYVSEIDKHVNGTKTLGENIADNGGLREAFLALKFHQKKYGQEPKLPGFEHLSPEQMFFLSYANLWCGVSTKDSLELDVDDEHSPPNLRSRGTLQNSEDFARSFNCRVGSPMNPARKRCIIF